MLFTCPCQHHVDGRLCSAKPDRLGKSKRSESAIARDSPIIVKTYPHIPKPQQVPQKSTAKKASPSGQQRRMSAQDGDYDQLSPAGRSCSHVVEADSKSQDSRCKQERRNPRTPCSIAINIAGTRNADTGNAVYPKLLATSVPSTPLFAQRKALNRSSSSGEQL